MMSDDPCLSPAPATEPDTDAAELAAATSDAPVRPAEVPEKFWDAASGSLRTDALLKSYLQLERKLGAMVPLPSDHSDVDGIRRLQRVLGVPASPDEYEVHAPHEALAPDPAINARLHEAGFTRPQAQLVYDLAAEHLLPAIEQLAAEQEARQEAGRLAEHFGGVETWQAIAPQIKTWAEANLAKEVYATLCGSYDGVLAMHQMMQAREPGVIREAQAPGGAADTACLAQMMRDPRYWRDRDPAFVAEVTAGYERLFRD
jgi:hypothetical protein